MQILIACAKLMDAKGVPALKFATKPTFEREALHNAAQLSQHSAGVPGRRTAADA